MRTPSDAKQETPETLATLWTIAAKNVQAVTCTELFCCSVDSWPHVCGKRRRTKRNRQIYALAWLQVSAIYTRLNTDTRNERNDRRSDKQQY